MPTRGGCAIIALGSLMLWAIIIGAVVLVMEVLS